MAADGCEALVAEVRALTERMCAAARAGEWESLPELTEARSRLFERLVESGLDRHALRRLLEETLAVDLRLRDLAVAARREIVERLRELSHSRRAAAAYLEQG